MLTEEDICSQILQKNGSGETSWHNSDKDQNDNILASLSPKRGEAMQAMHMPREFLEKSGAGLEQFYAPESQLL